MFAPESRSPTLRQLVVVYILPCQSVPVKFELKMCKVCFDESELELGRRALLAQRSCKGPRYRFPGRPEAAIRPRGSWALTSFVQWRSRGITKTGYLKFQLHTIFSEKKSIFITQKSVKKTITQKWQCYIPEQVFTQHMLARWNTTPHSARTTNKMKAYRQW